MYLQHKKTFDAPANVRTKRVLLEENRDTFVSGVSNASSTVIPPNPLLDPGDEATLLLATVSHCDAEVNAHSLVCYKMFRICEIVGLDNAVSVLGRMDRSKWVITRRIINDGDGGIIGQDGG
ncbi:hypothetical protein FRB99_000374 [Tulasnella sp. 403]|nr:hypothetical protein FRB99_000374 [Tulasnella sp. 403]